MSKRKLIYPSVSFFDEMEEEVNSIKKKKAKKSVEPPEKLFLQFDPSKIEFSSSNKMSNSKPGTHKPGWKPPVRATPSQSEVPESCQGIRSKHNQELDENNENISSFCIKQSSEDTSKSIFSNNDIKATVMNECKGKDPMTLTSQCCGKYIENKSEALEGDLENIEIVSINSTQESIGKKSINEISRNNSNQIEENACARATVFDGYKTGISKDNEDNFQKNDGSSFINTDSIKQKSVVSDACLKSLNKTSEEFAYDSTEGDSPNTVIKMTQDDEESIFRTDEEHATNSYEVKCLITELRELSTSSDIKDNIKLNEGFHRQSANIECIELVENFDSNIKNQNELYKPSDHKNFIENQSELLNEVPSPKQSSDKKVGGDKVEKLYDCDEMLVDSLFKNSSPTGECDDQKEGFLKELHEINENKFVEIQHLVDPENTCFPRGEASIERNETTIKANKSISALSENEGKWNIEQITVLKEYINPTGKPLERYLNEERETIMNINNECKSVDVSPSKVGSSENESTSLMDVAPHEETDNSSSGLEQHLEEEKNMNEIDEEYSCLMISNSQLLEIEKNFYETSNNVALNNTTSQLSDNDIVVLNQSSSIDNNQSTARDQGSTTGTKSVNKTSVGIQTEFCSKNNKNIARPKGTHTENKFESKRSVGIQTEFCSRNNKSVTSNRGIQTETKFKNKKSIGIQTESCSRNVLPSNQENTLTCTLAQAQLRDAIQEIESVNDILMKIKQGIWHPNQSENTPGGSRGNCNTSSLWWKK